MPHLYFPFPKSQDANTKTQNSDAPKPFSSAPYNSIERGGARPITDQTSSLPPTSLQQKGSVKIHQTFPASQVAFSIISCDQPAMQDAGSEPR